MSVTQKQENTVIVRPEGKITAANADDFRHELQDLVNAGAVDLTIDLSSVDMVDSKGLAVFIVCHKTITEKGGTLTVITDNEGLRGLFHVMRLDERFVVKGSE